MNKDVEENKDAEVIPFPVCTELHKLLKEREDLLNLHPELVLLQCEIDRQLSLCGDGKDEQSRHNRMVVISALMLQFVGELNKQLTKLLDGLRQS